MEIYRDELAIETRYYHDGHWYIDADIRPTLQALYILMCKRRSILIAPLTIEEQARVARAARAVGGYDQLNRLAAEYEREKDKGVIPKIVRLNDANGKRFVILRK